MLRTTFPLAAFLLLPSLLLLPVGLSEAGILGVSELDIDFTKPKQVLTKVRWDDTDLFRLTEKGLGRTKEPTGGRGVTLTTTEPLALGTWWRPTDNATVEAKVTWAGEHAGAMRGALFVSYSCDARQWSEWRHVRETTAGSKQKTREHETTLQIPRHVRTWYLQKLREYGKQDVPWSSDEEAFVTWHRERHPTAFTKSRPFIGYLRFMYETEIPHGTFIAGIDIDVTWAVSGLSSIPKDKAVEAIQEKRRDEPWSWRADGSHENPKGAHQVLADVTRVYDTSLRYLMAEKAKTTESGTRPPFERVIMHPYSIGATDILTLPHVRYGASWLMLRGMDRGLVRSFWDRSMRHARLPHDLDPGATVIYVSPRRWRSMRDDRGDHDWQEHYKRWPGSFGRVYVSGIGFSADRTQALLHIGREYGHLAGYGTLVHLAKTDGRWIVMKTTITWVS